MKNIKMIVGFLAVIGIMLVLGGAGKVDCADEIGEYIAMKDFVPQMILGLILMIPSWFVFKHKESEDEYETE